MKTHILIAFIFLLSFRASAQQDTIVQKNYKWLEIGLISTSVITGALGDGLNSRAKYTPGHLLASASVMSLLAIPFVVKPNWKFPVTYILVRYALFDVLYNAGAQRKWNYVGGKNYYDESVGRMPMGVLNGTKVVSLGIVIYLCQTKK